jgi:hypothetical protein
VSKEIKACAMTANILGAMEKYFRKYGECPDDVAIMLVALRNIVDESDKMIPGFKKLFIKVLQ